MLRLRAASSSGFTLECSGSTTDESAQLPLLIASSPFPLRVRGPAPKETRRKSLLPTVRCPAAQRGPRPRGPLVRCRAPARFVSKWCTFPLQSNHRASPMRRGVSASKCKGERTSTDPARSARLLDGGALLEWSGSSSLRRGRYATLVLLSIKRSTLESSRTSVTCVEISDTVRRRVRALKSPAIFGSAA